MNQMIYWHFWNYLKWIWNVIECVLLKNSSNGLCLLNGLVPNFNILTIGKQDFSWYRFIKKTEEKKSIGTSFFAIKSTTFILTIKHANLNLFIFNFYSFFFDIFQASWIHSYQFFRLKCIVCLYIITSCFPCFILFSCEKKIYCGVHVASPCFIIIIIIQCFAVVFLFCWFHCTVNMLR